MDDWTSPCRLSVTLGLMLHLRERACCAALEVGRMCMTIRCGTADNIVVLGLWQEQYSQRTLTGVRGQRLSM